MEGLLREFRYSWRTLTKSRGFAAIAMATLALGTGASTAIFSVVDAVLLRTLPYPDPQKIVRVWEQAPDGHRMNLSDPDFDDFRAQNNTFAGLAVYGDVLSSVSGGSEPERVRIAEVSVCFSASAPRTPYFRGGSGAAGPGAGAARDAAGSQWGVALRMTGDLVESRQPQEIAALRWRPGGSGRGPGTERRTGGKIFLKFLSSILDKRILNC